MTAMQAERPLTPPEPDIYEQAEQAQREERLRRWYADNPDYCVQQMLDREWLIDNDDDKAIFTQLAHGEAVEAYRIFDNARSEYVEWAVNECMSTGLYPAGFD